MILAAAACLAMLAAGCIVRKESTDTVTQGDYMGQEKPGLEPVLFAPQIVSTGFHDRDAAFSPDHTEFYYTMRLPGQRYVIMVMRRMDQRWTKPRVASFSGTYNDLEAAFSPDGRRLYFVSDRPRAAGGDARDTDIWYLERTESGWSEPHNPGPPLNTDGNEFYPSLALNGTIYFTADYDGSDDLYRARWVGGAFAETEKLGSAINTSLHEFNAMVAPDESYIIFTTVGRDDDIGQGDLYVSFRREDGGWAEAVNMGTSINSEATDFCPALSPDGRYFFFTSNRVSRENAAMGLKSLADVSEYHTLPQNGNYDIYWVDSKVIADLRPR